MRNIFINLLIDEDAIISIEFSINSFETLLKIVKNNSRIITYKFEKMKISQQFSNNSFRNRFYNRIFPHKIFKVMYKNSQKTKKRIQGVYKSFFMEILAKKLEISRISSKRYNLKIIHYKIKLFNETRPVKIFLF